MAPLKTGIVFSSGFFGFFAHAGFLAAVRKKGIPLSGFSGTSSGAIVAAMAASGMDDSEIFSLLSSVKKNDFWDPDPLNVLIKAVFKLFKGYTGYLHGKKFEWLISQIPCHTIESCKTPLVITTVNLSTRKKEDLTAGNLSKAVQASGAVPILFKPVEINGSLHVDGGYACKAPVEALLNRVPELQRVIVHYIRSKSLNEPSHRFLDKKLTPFHILHSVVNVSRENAYIHQLEQVKAKGIEVIEITTTAPRISPSHMSEGPEAYKIAMTETMCILEEKEVV